MLPKKGKGYLGNVDSSTVFLLTRKTLFISRLFHKQNLIYQEISVQDAEGWIAMATVQTLIPSVDMEDLITSVDATPTKTARLERSVTQETWTETGTTRSVFPMVVISWMITALAMMHFVTCLTMKTASTVTI